MVAPVLVAPVLLVRDLGRTRYQPVLAAMQAFTRSRSVDTPDEIWFTEHAPVYTQGQAGRAEHLLGAGEIPLVQSDRGGQITYHGPGQLVAYLLLDLRRLGLGPRALVSLIEDSLIALLATLGIAACSRADAPGVYVADAQGPKIAALGLRIRKGCSYHGLSLNVAMDLAPFAGINPCGMAGLAVAQISQWQPALAPVDLQVPLLTVLCSRLGVSWRHVPGNPPGV